jgi:hypothetical protein
MEHYGSSLNLHISGRRFKVCPDGLAEPCWWQSAHLCYGERDNEGVITKV